MMMNLPPKIDQYDPLEVARQQNLVQGGRTANQTALLQLEDMRRQQETAARMRQALQANPGLALDPSGGGPLLASPALTAGGGGPMTQQTTVPGQPPGAPQVVPGGQNLSQFATGGAPGGGMPGGPQSTIGGLAPPPRQHPIEALMRENPDAALKIMQLQQGQQDRHWKLQEQQLQWGLKSIEAVAQISQGVTNQDSLDQAREYMQQIAPQAAARLPKVYTKEAMEAFQAQALSVKERQTLKIANQQAQSDAMRAEAEIVNANLKLQQAGYQGLSDGVTGILKGLTPEQVQEFGGRTSDKAINYATKKWQDEKVQVSERQGAAQVGEQPLDDTTRQRVGAYRRGEQLANQLMTEFTPEERAKFVGMGGMRMTGKQLEAWLVDATTRQADPRFARFLTLLNEAKTEAFATGGKALTKQEADVVFGYIPTGAETSVEQFEQKLGQARTRSSERLDDEIKLATTPKRALAEERKSGNLARPGGDKGETTAGKGGKVSLETLAQYADKHKIPIGKVIKDAYAKGLEIE